MPGLDTAESVVKQVTFDAVVLEGAALVFGTLEDHATTPAAANSAAFMGFAKYAQAINDVGPLVLAGGIVMAISSGAVSLGDKVKIADTSGRVKTAVADDNVVGIALRASAATGDRFPVLVMRSPAGSGLVSGVVPSVRLNFATNPTNDDTITIGAKTFTFKTTLITATTTTQVKILGTAALTLAALLDAINGVTNANVVADTTPFTTSVVADAVSATVLRIRKADAQGGTAIAGTMSTTAFSETLTAAADIVNAANLNVSGKAATDNTISTGSVTITAAMITNGTFDVELPFTPTIVQWSGYASTGVPRAINEAVTISGNALHLVLAGGASPNWQANDTFRFIATI